MSEDKMFSDTMPGKQRAQSFKTRVGTRNATLRYLLHLPPSYGADEGQRWPLILFLHGSGERGANLDLVKRHGLARVLEHRRDFPAVVISPQCPSGVRWDPAVLPALPALLDEVAATHRIDPDRIYLTGISMGGFGAWALAIAQPQRFAALVPICGGGDATRVGAITHMPIWAFHGAKDTIVPVECTLEMIEALRAVGGEPRLTIYPELAHDSWTPTYDNPALYDWLFSQRRRHG